MVLARDHVFTTRFSFLEFMPETRLYSASCTNGPFLILLAIVSISNVGTRSRTA